MPFKCLQSSWQNDKPKSTLNPIEGTSAHARLPDGGPAPLPTGKAHLLFVKRGKLGLARALFRGGIAGESQTTPFGNVTRKCASQWRLLLSICPPVHLQGQVLHLIFPSFWQKETISSPFPAVLPVHKINKTLSFLEALEGKFQTFRPPHGGGNARKGGQPPALLAFYHTASRSWVTPAAACDPLHNRKIRRVTQHASYIKLQKSQAILVEMFSNLIIPFQCI